MGLRRVGGLAGVPGMEEEGSLMVAEGGTQEKLTLT